MQKNSPSVQQENLELAVSSFFESNIMISPSPEVKNRLSGESSSRSPVNFGLPTRPAEETTILSYTRQL